MDYCYILELSNKKLYIGYSSDLKHRVKEHVKGEVFTTKNFRPLKLIYYSAFTSKIKAIEFERYIKTNSGFAFRNKRLI